MSQTSNLMQGLWWPGYALNRRQKRATAGTVATAAHIFQGQVVIGVDGVATPAVSGAAMQLLCKKYAGGDANSNLYISARRGGVRVALTSGGAESITMALGSTIDFTVTFNAGTSTPNSLRQLIGKDPEADRLLRFSTDGNGTGTALVAVLIANGLVPFIECLGVAMVEENNAAGGAPAALNAESLYLLGGYGMNPAAGNVPLVDSIAYLADDDTITSVAFGTDLRGRVLGQTQDAAFLFLDLESVE